ncbi:MAG: hypothetical protein AB7T49_09050 [Oligoflexales bacterium]
MWINFLINDIRDLVSTLTFWDMLPYSMTALWVLVLCVPLTGIDKRDVFSGMGYAVFCMTAGIILIFTLHSKYSLPSTIGNVINVGVLLLGISAFRWTYRKRVLPSVFEISTSEETQNDQKKPNV